MNTHADKTQENKSQLVANAISKKQGGSASLFQFVDNRPETNRQRKLNEIVNNNQQTDQQKAFQETANNSSNAIQGKFNHKGKIYGPQNIKDKVPGIFKVSADDLMKLRDDEHDYGTITNQADAAAALAIYQQQNAPAPDNISLEDINMGHITMHTQDVGGHPNPVKIIYQIDAFQGKHDLPFMQEHSDGPQRKMQDTQMRLSKTDYINLSRGVPVNLATEKLGTILGKNQMERYDFSVMDTLQNDGLYYEISAMWAQENGTDTILVYYHCFPPKTKEGEWNKYKKPKEKKESKKK